jgi:peroxiredoxin family protein
MMKKIFFLLILLSKLSWTNAQSISNKVIATSGISFSNANFSVSQTVGEVSINTLNATGITLNQGFHQIQTNNNTSCNFQLNGGSDTIVVCGTSTTIDASSGFDTYLWSNGFTTSTITATAAGWYTCTVTQGSCSATDSVYLRISNVVPTAPSAITITPLQTNVCGARKYRYAVPVSTASSFTGYLWSFQGPLVSSMTIDSGSLDSRVLTVTYTSNEAASASDSVKCRYTSICGNSLIRAAKLSNIALNVPAAPASITITPVAQNVCGNRLYRYSAPNLPPATTTAGAATGWVWEITGSLGEFSNIDSGDINSQKILVSYTVNNAASAGDSIKLYYTSGCGDSKAKVSKLSNTSLKVPAAPTSIVITPLQTNVCGSRRYRYTAPILPVATTTSGAATGYVWDVKGSLLSSMTIDSGTLTSRSFIARFTSNAAASTADSVRVYYTSDCGNSLRRSLKLTNTLLNVPAAPATITITALQTNVCGARRYRYSAPVLPAATTTSGAATGYVWDLIGTLSSSMTVDSGSLTSRIFTATFTSNAASGSGDSVRVYYTSGCGNSLRKSSKLSNILLSAPLAPASITIQLKNDVCNARTYRYIAPTLPSATSTAGAATGYIWTRPIGPLGTTGTIDSGNVNSRIITVTYSSNAAAGVGDSIKLQYSSGCGNGAVKAQKLSNVAKVCPPGIFAKADSKETSITRVMQVFPNPNNGNFTIKIQTGITTTRKALIEIRDIQGRLIRTLNTENVNGAINQEVRNMGLIKGMYVVIYRLGAEHNSVKMIVE